jgi:hypothetical protein
VRDLLKDMKELFSIIPPEKRVPWRTNRSCAVVETDERETHIMPFVAQYYDTLKIRRKECVATCIVLLRFLPIPQRDLRTWLVQNLVFSTREEQVWDPVK